MRQIPILSVLLAASLAGAYLTWTADEADPKLDEQVIVYRAEAGDLTSITWEEDSQTIVLERKTDEAGTYTWVTLTERNEVLPEPEPTKDPGDEPADTGLTDEGPMPPDTAQPDDEGSEDEAPEGSEDEAPEGSEDEAPEGSEDEAPEDAPEPVIETQTVAYKGNSQADDLWEDFAPLYALRELQTAGASGSAAFGFDEPQATIEVVRGSGPLALVVGNETYGSKDRYVETDGRVFLVDDKTLRPLQFAKTRLVDRMLQPVSQQEAEQIEVTVGEDTYTFLHTNKDDRASAFWERKSNPGVADESVELWLGKFLRMRVQRYVSDDEVEEPLEPVFTAKVTGEERSWTVEVLQTADEADRAYYARSTYARSLLLLTESLAAEAVADLDSVLPDEASPQDAPEDDAPEE